MSYFSQKLRALMDKHDLSQSGLSTTTGIHQSQISRLLSEDRQNVSPDDLAAIAMNLTNEEHERAELLAAYLQDRCAGPGSKLVHIIVEGGSKHLALYDRPLPAPLSPQMERVFEILRANVNKKNLRTALLGLADLMEDQPPNSSRGLKVAGQVLAAAGDHARGATNGQRVPARPLKYKVARRSKSGPKP